MQAAVHVSVFKVYASILRFSDSDLRQLFAFLKERNIDLAIEFGPLTAAGGCGIDATGYRVEGFNGDNTQAIINKFKANGVTLKYVAMDEPFSFANIYDGRGACHWSPQQIATNAALSLNLLKAAFPGLIVGDIEPVPPGLMSDWVQRYAAWMDAFQEATGSKLAFFHVDTGYSANWVSELASVRTEVSKRGIPLGVIYNGLQQDSSDIDWLTHAQQLLAQVELLSGQPDQAIFQSWTAFPMAILPETTPYTFTWLIDQYVRPRSSLSLVPSATQAAGKLVDSTGKVISAAPITVTLEPTAGPGIVSTYTLTGKVPPSISRALIQMCVNLCGSQNTNHMSVYSFQYADSVNRSSLNFANGLAGWGVNGNGTATVQPGSDGTGKFLQISSTAAQQTFVNSSSFAVTPGGAYTLTVQARISPDSVGSGYFALIFLVDKEVSRDTLAYVPATLTLGTTQTGSDGSYSLQFPPQGLGVFKIQASYPGVDYPAPDARWAALVTAPLSILPSIRTNGVVNGANFSAEPLSPAAWFSIFGQNLGQAGQWTTQNTFTLGGASVSVCGSLAAISYNSGPITTNGALGWQLNALMPDGVAGQNSCPVAVTVEGQTSQASNVSIARGVMQLFGFTSPTGGSLPLITHADFSLVGPEAAGLTPARLGEQIVAWGTGDCTLPTVTVAAKPATVAFSGRTAPGLCQLNIVVPNGSAGSTKLAISTSPVTYDLWVNP